RDVGDAGARVDRDDLDAVDVPARLVTDGTQQQLAHARVFRQVGRELRGDQRRAAAALFRESEAGGERNRGTPRLRDLARLDDRIGRGLVQRHRTIVARVPSPTLE